VKLSPKSVLI